MKKSKKIAVLSTIVVGVGLVAGASYFTFFADRNNTSETSSDAETLNLDPPTEQDKQDAANRKEDIVNDENSNSPQNTPQNRTVTPVITYADQYGNDVEVGAYVPGIAESGGVCRADFAMGGMRLNKQVNAVSDASTVSCPVMSLGVTSFQKGIWGVTVTYSSSTATGVSSKREFTVR